MKTITSVMTALVLATTVAGFAFAAGSTDSAATGSSTPGATNSVSGAASTETNGPKANGQVDTTAPIYMAPNSTQPSDNPNTGNADATSKGKSH